MQLGLAQGGGPACWNPAAPVGLFAGETVREEGELT
jgi:hypothetical protein